MFNHVINKVTVTDSEAPTPLSIYEALEHFREEMDEKLDEIVYLTRASRPKAVFTIEVNRDAITQKIERFTIEADQLLNEELRSALCVELREILAQDE